MDEVRGEGPPRPARPKRKLNIPLPGPAANLPAPITPLATGDGIFDAKSELDRRIATAPIHDLSALVQARGALIQQDEWQREGAHIRRGRMGVFYSKIAFSVAAAVGGTTLIVAGFGLPGFFLLGGAAAVYVPEYVKHAVGQFRSGGDDAQ